MTDFLGPLTGVPAIGLVLAVLAVLAAVRRLVRTAVGLGMIALLAGLGPPVLGSVDDQLRDVGLDVGGAVDAVTGGDADVRGRRPEAVDGDTFNVRADGEPVRVRVALIDAGESSASRYGRPTCGGEAATRFAKAWAARRRGVRLQAVGGLPAEDRYGRRLARLVDRRGRDYGLAIVRDGWARIAIYERPQGAGAAYLARLKAAEAQARATSRGAWGTCDWKTQEGVR